MMTPREQLLAEAAKRILITDGAFGTEIQNWKLAEADYAGDLGLAHDQKGNNDILALTKPEVPETITRAYLEAGVGHRLDQHLLRQLDQPGRLRRRASGARDQHRLGADRAAPCRRISPRRTAARASSPARSGRPTRRCRCRPDVNDPGFREIDFDYLKDVYREQIDALVEGGVGFHPDRDGVRHANAKAGDHGGDRGGRGARAATCRSCCR